MVPYGVGVVGCGNISGIYLRNLDSFPGTEVVRVFDLDPAKSAATGLPAAKTIEELLDDPGVHIVLNLTTPKSHFEVARAALRAGKHVYNEKPLAVELAEGNALMEEAESRGLLVGCAPDTVLGAGVQTCRALIDSGAIGEPVAAQAFMMCAGHESWHPDPAFYYEKGGGPLFDMGPYYLSALVTLLGPIATVCGMARATFPFRTITSEPKRGQRVPVETPTHLSAVLGFCSGAIGQITTSFDVAAHGMPHIEIYGSEGSLRVPDPNGFGGEALIRTKGASDWQAVPLERPYAENSRGLGVWDLARAIDTGARPRASGEIGLHVLEAMHAAHTSAAASAHVQLSTRPAKPEPMPREGF